jgi:hypothetical protein
MEVIKTIIPLATFLLGVLATLAFKYHDRRRDILCENVHTLCGLAEEWYNRVQSLGRTVSASLDREVVEEALVNYLQGSLFLPRFRRSMTLLERFKKCEPFLEEARAFLSVLTQVEQVQLNTYLLPWRERYFNVMGCMTPTIVEGVRSAGKPVRRLLLLPDKSKSQLSTPIWRTADQDNMVDVEAVSGFDATDPIALANLYARVQKMHVEAANLVI